MLFSTPITVLLYALVFTARNVDVVSAADQLAAQELAARYGLTTSTTLLFPSATQTSSDAQNQIVSNWSLNKGRIQDGADNLAFVTDPFPNNSPTGIPTIANTSGGPMLEVTYPKGSFSHDTGGSQFYSLWNTSDGSSFGSMMVSYEVAFNWDFDFVKGGKLPGLRGGLDSSGCSGGNEATGQDCFSSRVMWRANAAGEVYAYIPSPNNLCSAKSIICNSDFGISISRGSFGFVRGQWNRVTMLVQINNPPDVANGQILLYYNDLPAIAQQNLQIRSSDSLVANGFYFSTFFGGSDASWATPETVNSYFRNIHLWGGSAPSNLTGEQVRNLASRSASCNLFIITFAVLASALAVYL